MKLNHVANFRMKKVSETKWRLEQQDENHITAKKILKFLKKDQIFKFSRSKYIYQIN